MNSPLNAKTKYITLIMAAVLTVAFAAALTLDLLPRIRKEAVVKGISEYTSKDIAPKSTSEFEFSCTRSGFDHLVFFVMDGGGISDEARALHREFRLPVLQDRQRFIL